MTILRFQKGQGMVSFLVAAIFLLVPMSLGINYLAKLGDTKHKTLMAARYALWERTAWHPSASKYNFKSNVEINNEITTRIFGQADIPIDSLNDKKSGTAATPLYSNLYMWSAVTPRPSVIKSFADNKVTELTIKNNSPSGAVSTAVGWVVGSFKLEQKGFYTSEVSMNYKTAGILQKELAAILPSGEELNIKSHSAMLVGSWNVKNASALEDGVKGVLLTDRLDDPALQVFKAAIGVFHPEINRFTPGLVKPDIVPCQRINRGGLACE